MATVNASPDIISDFGRSSSIFVDHRAETLPYTPTTPSCRALGWTQITANILSGISFASFKCYNGVYSATQSYKLRQFDFRGLGESDIYQSPPEVLQEVITLFVDPPFLTAQPSVTGSITSILVCRFILSLRRFDSGSSSEVDTSDVRIEWLQATSSGLQRQLRGHMASTSTGVLQFAALPSETLPAFIASFGHPVHVDDLELEMDPEVDAELEEIVREDLLY
ncbi:hypothetical protein GSI_04996 [Ganoderma sinense ZZ0214-1]|uniref:Uncharacterized protein n=1 Tax=Ganoderma sinense ZZ0214-1 TaxID=1077348 RepID=A0A2G8SH33_9APHY|nr:hypothetical protein GSI_04996 [Ganoderma sinense ZZ0214-1]